MLKVDKASWRIYANTIIFLNKLNRVLWWHRDLGFPWLSDFLVSSKVHIPSMPEHTVTSSPFLRCRMKTLVTCGTCPGRFVHISWDIWRKSPRPEAYTQCWSLQRQPIENINEGTVTVNRGLERLSLRLIRHFLYLLAM